VVDKIRADFNTGKRDRYALHLPFSTSLVALVNATMLTPPPPHPFHPRCVQVAQHRSDDPTAWAEFSTKAKEGIVATFDANVALYEEDVRKADSQRQLEGWQYLTFFLQKVS